MDQRLQILQREALSGDPEAHERLWAHKRRLGLRRLVGLSLSFCVKDILRGLVRVPEVEKLYLGTTGFVQKVNGRVVPGEGWDRVFTTYMTGYWAEHPFGQNVVHQFRVKSILQDLLPVMEETGGHQRSTNWIDGSYPWGWASPVNRAADEHPWIEGVQAQIWLAAMG